MKRGGKFFNGIQSTKKYPSISKKEAFKVVVRLKLQPIQIVNCLLIDLNKNSSL